MHPAADTIQIVVNAVLKGEVINTDENRVFLTFKPLIFYTIKKYYPEYVSDDDVFQEASIGLLYAMRAYDESRKTMFTTFAVACIRNAIRTYLRDKRVKEKPDRTVFIDDVYATHKYSAYIIPGREDALYEELSANTQSNIRDIITAIDFYDFYKRLSEDQKKIVHMLIFGYTTTEIGDEFGVSHQAVSLRIKTIRELYRKFLKGGIVHEKSE